MQNSGILGQGHATYCREVYTIEEIPAGLLLSPGIKQLAIGHQVTKFRTSNYELGYFGPSEE